jgi:hypothetical protein
LRHLREVAVLISRLCWKKKDISRDESRLCSVNASACLLWSTETCFWMNW